MIKSILNFQSMDNFDSLFKSIYCSPTFIKQKYKNVIRRKYYFCQILRVLKLLSYKFNLMSFIFNKYC